MVTNDGTDQGVGPEARRFATLLRFDIVQSTNYTDAHPEEPEPLLSFLQKAGDLCVEHGGIVEQFQGDALIISFGVSSPVEQSARQAVEAGLAVRNLTRERMDFDARIAVHHGLTQVARVGGGGWSVGTVVTGLGPTVVSRVEAAAPSGTLVITDYVADIVRNQFEIDFLGEHALRGISKPIGLYSVTGPLTARQNEGGQTAETQIIGRESEIADLQAASLGQRSTLLVGESGIGKTRTIREAFSTERTIWIQCRSETQLIPLAPLIKTLSSQIGSVDVADVEQFLVAELELSVELAKFVARTLTPSESDIAPTDRSDEICSAFVQTFASLSAALEAVLVVDDCQWADPLTAACLTALPKAAPLPTVIAAMRPDAVAGWEKAWPGQRQDLGPLSDEASERLIRSLINIDDLEIGQLVSRAEGVPFFLEELAYVYEKDRSIEALPPSLRELLDSRIDHRSAIERALIEILAVLGGVGSSALIVEMAVARNEDRISAEAALATLGRSGLLRRTGDDVEFGHDFLRQAAYDRIRIGDRPRRHRVAAEVLETAEERVTIDPEVIAEQWSSGEEGLRAGPYWLEAGVTAARRGAQRQSIALLDRALESLGDAPPADLELQEPWVGGRVAGQLWRGAALTATAEHGYADEAVGMAYEEVHGLLTAITESVGVQPEIFPAYYGVWTYYFVRGEHNRARAYVEDCLAAAEASGAKEDRLIASCFGGYQRMFEGHLDSARQLLETAIELDVVELKHPVPHDPGAVSMIALAVVEQLCGNQRAADEYVEQTLMRIEKVPSSRRTFTQAYVGCYLAWIRQAQGDPIAALDHAETAEALATANSYPTWMTAAQLHAGIARGTLDDPDAANDTRSALQTWDSLGHRLMRPYFATKLAHLTAAHGDVNEAHRLAKEAAAQVESSGEFVWANDIRLLFQKLEPLPQSTP